VGGERGILRGGRRGGDWREGGGGGGGGGKLGSLQLPCMHVEGAQVWAQVVNRAGFQESTCVLILD